jgi:hypothetical protein
MFYKSTNIRGPLGMSGRNIDRKFFTTTVIGGIIIGRTYKGLMG